MHVELNLIEIDVALLLNTIKGKILETQLRTSLKANSIQFNLHIYTLSCCPTADASNKQQLQMLPNDMPFRWKRKEKKKRKEVNHEANKPSRMQLY